jgi:hypothetical protein
VGRFGDRVGRFADHVGRFGEGVGRLASGRSVQLAPAMGLAALAPVPLLTEAAGLSTVGRMKHDAEQWCVDLA